MKAKRRLLSKTRTDCFIDYDAHSVSNYGKKISSTKADRLAKYRTTNSIINTILKIITHKNKH